MSDGEIKDFVDIEFSVINGLIALRSLRRREKKDILHKRPEEFIEIVRKLSRK